MNRLVIKYWEIFPPPDDLVRERGIQTFELEDFCLVRQGMILPEIMILITALADGAQVDEIFGIWKGPELLGWSAFQYLADDAGNCLNVVALIGIGVYQSKLMDLLRLIAQHKNCSHITAKFIFQRQIPIIKRLGWNEIRPGIFSLKMDVNNPDPDSDCGPGWESIKRSSVMPASAGGDQ